MSHEDRRSRIVEVSYDYSSLLEATVPSYKEYQEQIAKLQSLAEEARQEEIAQARAQVGELMRQHGLTASDVLGVEKKVSLIVRRTATAKYRDPLTGQTWSGRGRQPRWLDKKNSNEFLIKYEI